MEERETPWMYKYGESKRTWIMMETVRHVTSGSGLLLNCQPMKRQHCGNLRFCSCCFCNIMRLDDGESACILEQRNGILVYTVWMFFSTFQHI